MKFQHFGKKIERHSLKFFRNYSLRKTLLLKCIAGPVSEHA